VFKLFLLAQVVDTAQNAPGLLLTIAYGSVAAAFTGLLFFAGRWLAKKGSQSSLWSIVDKVGHIAITSVAAAEAELKPHILAALQDGKITAEERADLQLKALAAFKLQLGPANMDAIRKHLGISDTGLDSYLWGLVQSVIQRLAGTGSTSPVLALLRPENPAPPRPFVP
jgi:hypothetical protein